MRKIIAYLILNILLISCVYSSKNDFRHPKDAYSKKEFKMPERFLNMNFVKEEPSLNKFANHGRWHSSYIILNQDSSFIYSCFYEIGHAMTLGTYGLKNNHYAFNWDSVKTSEACKDTMFLKQKLNVENYKTLPNKIDNVEFYLGNDNLRIIK
ncbi:hypothetical protein PEDI_34650 [Persicobacter diffluens]|uniref:Lipoprotein n=2 Tax=Persicobacter diffluens TaxID=981 RepID=A0AAN4W1J1_9BACT|nr:hypothetical protein PEDI_34650 [Persicobacter diffluens]